MCRECLHHSTLATKHVSNRPRGAKLICCLTQALAGCPAIPAEMNGDKQPCGGLPHGRSSSTSQSGGSLPQGRFPTISLISIEYRTFHLMPLPCREGTAAGFHVCNTTWLEFRDGSFRTERPTASATCHLAPSSSVSSCVWGQGGRALMPR